MDVSYNCQISKRDIIRSAGRTVTASFCCLFHSALDGHFLFPCDCRESCYVIDVVIFIAIRVNAIQDAMSIFVCKIGFYGRVNQGWVLKTFFLLPEI